MESSLFLPPDFPNALAEIIWGYWKESDTCYVLFQKRVRNDDHCPTCRRCFVTLYSSPTTAAADVCVEQQDEAAEEDCTENSGEEEKDCESQDESQEDGGSADLIAGTPIWIDEWVRRSNGDLYQVFAVLPDTWYSFQDWDKRVAGDLELQQDTKLSITHLSLHISVRPREWCPDNILFQVAFHQSEESARKYVLEEISERVYSYPDSDDSADSVAAQQLREGSPVWLALNKQKLRGEYKARQGTCYEKGQTGDHFQVIALQRGVRVCLNADCPQIQSENWVSPLAERVL